MNTLQIFKNNTAILIVGSEVLVTYHRHHALQVSIALDNPFRLSWETAEGATKNGAFEAVVIAPDVNHSLDGAGGLQALLLIDPEHRCAQQLKEHWLGDEAIAPLPSALRSQLIKSLTVESLGGRGRSSLKLIPNLLDRLVPRNSGLASMDQRVRQALDYLQSQPIKCITASELSSAVHLSESRLAHLFKQQVGIPVRRYLMWLRLMDAIEWAFAGHSLTDAAAHAGFSDSAHFSRTFQAMFGLQPSLVVQHSQFVQAP